MRELHLSSYIDELNKKLSNLDLDLDISTKLELGNLIINPLSNIEEIKFNNKSLVITIYRSAEVIGLLSSLADIYSKLTILMNK